MNYKNFILSRIAMSSIMVKGQKLMSLSLIDDVPEIFNPSYVGADSSLNLKSVNTLTESFSSFMWPYIMDIHLIAESKLGKNNGLGVMYNRQEYSIYYFYNSMSLMYSRKISVFKNSISLGAQVSYSDGRHGYESLECYWVKPRINKNSLYSAKLGANYVSDKIELGYSFTFNSDEFHNLGENLETASKYQHIINGRFNLFDINEVELDLIGSYVFISNNNPYVLGVSVKYLGAKFGVSYTSFDFLHFKLGYSTQKLTLLGTFGLNVYDRFIALDSLVQLMVGYKFLNKKSS